MLIRQTIEKLAASAVPALQVAPRFQNELLQSKTWLQDVKYLRDTYDEIQEIWELYKAPAEDQKLYQATDPKLQELVQALEDVSKQLSSRRDLHDQVNNAKGNFGSSAAQGRAGDYPTATVYQSYALVAIHNILDQLTREGNKPRTASFLKKKGYGYDVSGEITEGIGNNADQKSLNDTAQPQDHHTTKPNPANMTVDSEAEQEFPELKAMHQKVHFPARN